MATYEIDPLTDPRWNELVRVHPRSSVFHTAPWLQSLYLTYGYESVAFTISAPGEQLKSALVFCHVKSWLTGSRLVSLPFSDHCEPLVDDPADLESLLASLQQKFCHRHWNYIEIRPLQGQFQTEAFFHQSETYCFHQLDLSPDLDTLFRGFHKDSIQRKIRRAEREGVTIERGRSERLIDTFYQLQLLTRRRHRVPPQPRTWFRNLASCFGDSLTIRVAYKDSRPLAAILTLSFKDTIVYKYGCSDPAFSSLGGTQLLFWSSIQEAKQSALRQFDFGRSDTENPGLITFKDRWGAERSSLTYWRYPQDRSQVRSRNKSIPVAKHIFAHAPDAVLCTIGGLLYKHFG